MTVNTIAREMAASWAEHHKRWHDHYLQEAQAAETRAKESKSWVTRFAARATAQTFRDLAADHLDKHYEKLEVASGTYLSQLIVNSCGILIQKNA